MQSKPEQTTWVPIGAGLADQVRQLVNDTTQPDAPVVERCLECGGAGYYTAAVPYGHPHFGVLFPCGCRLAAQQQQRRASLMQLSNLTAFCEQTFATFDSTVSGLKDAVRAAQAYAEQPHGWLVFLGSYGVGKTHLAAAIANAAVERDEAVLLVVVPDLLDHLRAAFAPMSEVAYDERFEQVRTVPLLILDDLGTEAATPWAREKLYQLLNHRYQERLPTVIATNHTLNDLDPRLVSRMTDRRLSHLITIEAEDYRQCGEPSLLPPKEGTS